MQKINKIVAYSLLGLLALSSFVSTASAITLKARDQQIKQRYQAARRQYLKEVNWWQTARQQFIAARSKYKQFKNTDNRTAYEDRAKDFLGKTVTVLIKKLETLKNWVSNRRALSDAERQAIIAEIDSDISWLQTKQDEIANASASQLKTYAAEIRTYWHKQRWQLKKIIGRIWVARLDWVIGRFENVADKIDAKIAKFKAAGHDTAQIEAWLSDVRDKINLAKAKEQSAKEKYQAISNLTEANAFFNEARQFIKQANQYLRQAHQDLVKIIKAMKDLNTSTANAK